MTDIFVKHAQSARAVFEAGVEAGRRRELARIIETTCPHHSYVSAAVGEDGTPSAILKYEIPTEVAEREVAAVIARLQSNAPFAGAPTKRDMDQRAIGACNVAKTVMNTLAVPWLAVNWDEDLDDVAVREPESNVWVSLESLLRQREEACASAADDAVDRIAKEALGHVLGILGIEGRVTRRNKAGFFRVQFRDDAVDAFVDKDFAQTLQDWVNKQARKTDKIGERLSEVEAEAETAKRELVSTCSTALLALGVPHTAVGYAEGRLEVIPSYGVAETFLAALQTRRDELLAETKTAAAQVAGATLRTLGVAHSGVYGRPDNLKVRVNQGGTDYLADYDVVLNGVKDQGHNLVVQTVWRELASFGRLLLAAAGLEGEVQVTGEDVVEVKLKGGDSWVRIEHVLFANGDPKVDAEPMPANTADEGTLGNLHPESHLNQEWRKFRQTYRGRLSQPELTDVRLLLSDALRAGTYRGMARALKALNYVSGGWTIVNSCLAVDHDGTEPILSVLVPQPLIELERRIVDTRRQFGDRLAREVSRASNTAASRFAAEIVERLGLETDISVAIDGRATKDGQSWPLVIVTGPDDDGAQAGPVPFSHYLDAWAQAQVRTALFKQAEDLLTACGVSYDGFAMGTNGVLVNDRDGRPSSPLEEFFTRDPEQTERTIKGTLRKGLRVGLGRAAAAAGFVGWTYKERVYGMGDESLPVLSNLDQADDLLLELQRYGAAAREWRLLIHHVSNPGEDLPVEISQVTRHLVDVVLADDAADAWAATNDLSEAAQAEHWAAAAGESPAPPANDEEIPF